MTYRFADCELDLAAHELRRGGALVHVEPQVFDLLSVLAAAGNDLVSYDTLIERVWQGRIVSDSTMAARISSARAAVGDTGKAQQILRTIVRRGVQMAVPVVSSSVRAAAADGLARQVIRYTTSADGTGIAYATTGEGPPLLRAGHWLSHLEHDWSSPVWRPVLERLGRGHMAQGRKLVRYDPRNTGLSDRKSVTNTFESWVDDLEAVADAAGLDRFPIYAISQSVPIALAFAARRPERVSHLVLINGLVTGSSARGDTQATDTMVGLINSGWGVPGSAFIKAFATLFMPQATPEEIDSFVEFQSLSATPEAAATLRRKIGDIDVSSILDKVVAPALIFHCHGDVVQHPDQSKLLARRLADAEFHLMPSNNHVVVPSDPVWESCAREIDRFLADPAKG